MKKNVSLLAILLLSPLVNTQAFASVPRPFPPQIAMTCQSPEDYGSWENWKLGIFGFRPLPQNQVIIVYSDKGEIRNSRGVISYPQPNVRLIKSEDGILRLKSTLSRLWLGQVNFNNGNEFEIVCRDVPVGVPPQWPQSTQDFINDLTMDISDQ